MIVASANHYVPVLRWKRGERIALRELGPERARVVPLIEPITDTHGAPWAEQFVAQVATNWGSSAFFLDLGPVKDDAEPAIRRLMRTAMAASVAPVLVTSLAGDRQSQEILKAVGINSDQGVCVRIAKAQLRSAVLAPRLEFTLDLLRRRAGDVDVVIDYGLCSASDPPLAYVQDRLPRYDAWRSLVFLAGSFPKDLRGLSVGEHELARREWALWSKQIAALSSRVPSFGDYTTQHPVYEDPPENANVSASIRYASKEYWVVMRGEGLRNRDGAGYAQYPGLAQLLLDRKEYSGPEFSYGDRYISQIASGSGGTTGNAESWLRAGINHHIGLTVRQISEVVAG